MIKERITREVTKRDEDCAAISSILATNIPYLQLELVIPYVFETHSMKMAARVQELKTFHSSYLLVIFFYRNFREGNKLGQHLMQVN